MGASSSFELRGWKRRPMFARMYPRMAASGDSIGFAAIREWAMSRARGSGIEIGCGDGRNFEYLPDGVTLTAIEPDPKLASAARTRGRSRAVTVIEGIGEEITVPSESVEFVITTLTLCTVGDLRATLSEVQRVLRPGGSLIAVEHIASSASVYAVWQRLADLVWPHVSGGCHTTRDILEAIEDAGFDNTELVLFDFPSRRSLSPARPMFKGVFKKAAPEE